MKTLKRLIALVLVILTLGSTLVLSASAASWRTGNFGNGYTTVYLNNTRQNGYIKIHTYNCVKGNHTGSCWGSGETNAKLCVTLRDTRGNWICQFDTTSRTKLKLGNDHSAYRVYIACRQDLGAAANFDNLGKCSHWAIEPVSNVRF